MFRRTRFRPGDEERGGRLAFEPRRENMSRTGLVLTGLAVVLLALAACESSTEEIAETTSTPAVTPSTTETPGEFEPVGTDLTTPLPAGDVARGEQFWDAPTPVGPGCTSCHTLADASLLAAGQVIGINRGPALFGIADRAGTTREGYSAEEYLHESIVLPCEFLAEGPVCLMPRNFGERLDAQDVADLIAFLMTQSG